jgi:putative transposase
MFYNPEIHHRKSIRLKGYDYSRSGLYYITICVHKKVSLFGHIENNKMILNESGKMIENEWIKLPQRFRDIELHTFITMPNHFHAIIEIKNQNFPIEDNEIFQNLNLNTNDLKLISENVVENSIESNPKHNLGNIIGAFKSITTLEYINGVNQLGWQSFDRRIWQRNYWESIIWTEKAYKSISQYIQNNPQNWKGDEFFKPF